MTNLLAGIHFDSDLALRRVHRHHLTPRMRTRHCRADRVWIVLAIEYRGNGRGIKRAARGLLVIKRIEAQAVKLRFNVSGLRFLYVRFERADGGGDAGGERGDFR